eukprot:TRINITY_DN791_c0_g2_i1.p1 TRINITY_DN791_c0_g2~~TRINITY_DN791_c0_g2_i1.p1  ORF type:complete len:276 (+),score=53.34 TRINITY_DN791_c0_g2_i1:95-922(+)
MSLGSNLGTVALCGDACEQTIGCRLFSVGPGVTPQCNFEGSTCSTTQPSPELNVFALPTIEKPPRRYSLTRMNQECSGPERLLGIAHSAEACSELCSQTVGCEYFLTGTGETKGKCYWEENDCTSFEDGSFNTYRQKNVLTQVAKQSECSGGEELLGKDLTLQSCGALCQQNFGCKFFLVGSGENEGMCYMEKTRTCRKMVDSLYDTYTYKDVVELPKDYGLVRRGERCAGAMISLGEKKMDLAACAFACKQQEDCELFILGLSLIHISEPTRPY